MRCGGVMQTKYLQYHGSCSQGPTHLQSAGGVDGGVVVASPLRKIHQSPIASASTRSNNPNIAAAGVHTERGPIELSALSQVQGADRSRLPWHACPRSLCTRHGAQPRGKGVGRGSPKEGCGSPNPQHPATTKRVPEVPPGGPPLPKPGQRYGLKPSVLPNYQV